MSQVYGSKNSSDVSCKTMLQGRLVTFCVDNSLHLWEINIKPTGATVLEEVKSYAMDTRYAQVYAKCNMYDMYVCGYLCIADLYL